MMKLETLKELSKNGFNLEPREMIRIDGEMVVVDWFQPDFDWFIAKLPKACRKDNIMYSLEITPAMSVNGGFYVGYVNMLDTNKAMFKLIYAPALSDALGNTWIKLKKDGYIK